jgi:Domain of unknown function (DUF4157)
MGGTTQSRVGAKGAAAVPAVQGLGAVRPFAAEGERAALRVGGLAPGFSFGKLPIQATAAADGVLQRKCEQCEEKIQPKGEGASVGGMGAPPIVQQVLRSPGQPLDPGTRALMEPRFGHDFSQVRVHADTRAAESARAVHAHAYTQGEHIVFAGGRYAPTTSEGRRLVGHELAHVVQQSAGRVVAPVSSGEVPIVANPLLEEEADAAGERAARGELARVLGVSGGGAQLKSQGGPIQRDCDPNTQSCRVTCDPSTSSCSAGTVDPSGRPNPGTDTDPTPQLADAGPSPQPTEPSALVQPPDATPVDTSANGDPSIAAMGMMSPFPSVPGPAYPGPIPEGPFEFPKIPGETPFQNPVPGAEAGGETLATGAEAGGEALATGAEAGGEALATGAGAGEGLATAAGAGEGLATAAGAGEGLATAAGVGGTVATGAGVTVAEAALPVTLAAGAGVLTGMALDKGVDWVGKQIYGDDKDHSISGAIAGGLTSADQAVSSLWADPSKPAYTQTLGWKLANLLTPTAETPQPSTPATGPDPDEISPPGGAPPQLDPSAGGFEAQPSGETPGTDISAAPRTAPGTDTNATPVTDTDQDKKKGYLCTAKCQSNGAPGGAYYVSGTSTQSCAQATLNAKASVPQGEYPRHCSCSDTDGFRGTGTQCENHSR